MTRKPIGNGERYAVLERCNFACFYCGTPAQLGLVRLQIEHVIPVSQCGGNEPWNLVAACAPCNSGKSAQTPTATVVQAAMDLYMASVAGKSRVRLCVRCQRPWVPDVTDLEPMDECWPCVRAWIDGRWEVHP